MLTLNATTVAGAKVAIDGVVELEIDVSSTPGVLDSRIRIRRNGNSLETFRLRRREGATGIIRYVIPFNWVDTPGAGTHTYTLNILGTPNNVSTVNAETRIMRLFIAEP